LRGIEEDALVASKAGEAYTMIRVVAIASLFVVALAFGPAAQAVPIVFTANLDGPSENPPNASSGTGTAVVIFDITAHFMQVMATFEDLIGATTASHIHCCTPPPGNVGVATAVPTFPGFPLGVTNGSYDMTFDMTLASSYNPAFVTANGGTVAGAEAALFAGLQAGEAYFNIHTNVFAGGEIRGFLQQVPEPGTLGLLSFGLIGAFFARRRGR
jgi:hypothetical protein